MKAGWQADNVSTLLVTCSFDNIDIKTYRRGQVNFFMTFHQPLIFAGY